MSTPSDAPLVAIVGRPNVGKSTLFNRIVGARQAIVEDKPGVTRDRLYGAAEWDGGHFLIVDTGGLDPSLDTGLPAHIRAQAEVAVEEADVVLFVVDAVDGATAVDYEIAELLRRSGKPILLVANKVDGPKRELAALSTAELGMGTVFPVSGAHGRGIGDLCDAILLAMPAPADEPAQAIPPGTRLAFMGRPNAGKSTLVNTLLGQERVIVSAEPGTTRDPVYLPFEWRGRPLVLTDTAGLRRRRQVARAMEKLAAIKAIRTMERTQIVVLMLDASLGVTDQDQRLARMAFERGKGVVVLLHKWDQLVGDAKKARETMNLTEEKLAFLEQVRIVKTSVVGDGRDQGKGKAYNLDNVLEACVATSAALEKRIPTSALNQELAEALAHYPPPLHKGRRIKLYYATQAESDPPLIVVSANMGRCLEPAYERYLLRRIRKRWHLWGIPIRIVVRGRGKGNSARAGSRSR